MSAGVVVEVREDIAAADSLFGQPAAPRLETAVVVRAAVPAVADVEADVGEWSDDRFPLADPSMS
jgi:hypothetical protein